MDLEQLEKLNELKEKGVLSQEEFDEKKKEILNFVSKKELINECLEGQIDIDKTNIFSLSWKSYIYCFKNFANGKIRGSRLEFFGFTLIDMIIRFLLGFCDGLLGTGFSFYEIYQCVSIVPGIALLARRMRDVNTSPWFILTIFVPVIKMWFKGDIAENKYGPAPITSEKKANIVIANIFILITCLIICFSVYMYHVEAVELPLETKQYTESVVQSKDIENYDNLICTTEGNINFCKTKKLKPYTGYVYMNFPNSKVVHAEFYMKQGKTNGIVKTYYENGTLLREGNHVDGKPDGIQKEYYNNGQIKGEMTFKDGNVNGIARLYYENGQLKEESYLKYDGYLKVDGKKKGYYENGQLKFEGFYIDDKANGIVKTYYENGQLDVEKSFKDGKEDGMQKSYFENGHLHSEISFKDGKMDGIYKLYHDNGNLWMQNYFVNGKVNGIAETYYKNGKLQQKAQYKNGDFNGLYEEYYDNGQLKLEANRVNDNFDGEVYEYRRNGSLKSRKVYEDGRLVFY